MKMKLFKYGYLIRHAFDLGRIFPIIIKQRGVSKFLAGVSSHIVETPVIIWNLFSELVFKVNSFLLGLPLVPNVEYQISKFLSAF